MRDHRRMVTVHTNGGYMDREIAVRRILGAWINKRYADILPLLDANVIYMVGEGAAQSICHTPGVFVGKEKVEQWYNSHSVMGAVHGEGVITPFCLIPEPPDVFTFEDAHANMVTAMGMVGTNVKGELPCTWMSLWHFKGDLVDFMMLTADSVGGLKPFEAFRRSKVNEYHAGEFAKAESIINSFSGRSSGGARRT
jgi:hypothetical protein